MSIHPSIQSGVRPCYVLSEQSSITFGLRTYAGLLSLALKAKWPAKSEIHSQLTYSSRVCPSSFSSLTSGFYPWAILFRLKATRRDGKFPQTSREIACVGFLLSSSYVSGRCTTRYCMNDPNGQRTWAIRQNKTSPNVQFTIVIMEIS